MKSLKESAFGIACVLILVACGFAYIKYADPDPETGVLPFLGGEGPGRQRHITSVRAIDWSADGRLLLSLSLGESFPDGPLLLHDRDGARMSLDVCSEEILASAALSRDGLHVLVGTHRGQLLWFDAESSQTRTLLELPEPFTMKPVSLSPDGRLAAAAIDDGRIFVCDINSEAPPRVFQGPPCTMSELSFSADGLRLACAWRDGSVTVWELAEGKREWEFAAHDRLAIGAAFLAGGQKVVTAGWDDTVRIWNIVEQREEWTAQFERGTTSTLAVSVDGKTAAWGGFNHKIMVWDLECRRMQLEIATPSTAVMKLKFSPDGKILAAAGIEKMIRLYDVSTGAELPGIEVGAPTAHRRH